jgi:restriction system protein
MGSCFLVRVGEGSRYAETARGGGFVAIGWSNLGDLTSVNSTDQLRSAFFKAYPEYSKQQLAANVGQVARFLLTMQDGDTLLMPLGNGKYAVGRAGRYIYESVPSDGCPYKHRRFVDWELQNLSKADMSTNLTYALGSTLTVFSLAKYAEEIDALRAGLVFSPAEKPQKVRDLVLAALLELDGKEFEEFISHLLEVVGFQAEATQYSRDKGIDVMGTLDAEGLADINLRVQAKRIRSVVSRKDVAALRGDLEQDQLGCFITTSTFSPDAEEAATSPNKKPIKLIDGNGLAAIILKTFDGIDESYKARFGIRRRRDYNIDDQFEPNQPEELVPLSEPPVKPGRSVTNASEPLWDTIVCASHVDGFKDAFMKQRAWWAVRISEQSLSAVKYVAIYQVAPVSAITHYGEVERIEPYKDTGKYKLFLKGDPIALAKPVTLGNIPNLKPQGPKYAKLKVIKSASTLDDIWGERYLARKS